MSSNTAKAFEMQSVASPLLCKNNNTFLSVMLKASKLKTENKAAAVTVEIPTDST